MNDGELRNVERELGRLVGLMEGFGREMRTMREDGARREASFLAAIADHDKRDDERFAANGREHETMSRTLTLLEEHDTKEHSAEAVSGQRWHNWQLTLLSSLAVIAAALVSAVATARLIGTH